MADPTDPNAVQQMSDMAQATSQAADATRSLADAQNYAKDQLSAIGNVIDNTSGALDALTTSYNSVASGIKDGIFQDNEARNVGLITTALLGATDALNQFHNAAVSIQQSPFLAPIKEMEVALQQGGGLLDSVGSKVLSVFGSVMPEEAKKSSAAVVTFAKNLLTSSGNAIYLRDAVLGLGGATGNLDKIYKAAGPNLENINEIMAQQSERIQGTAETMNISREQAMKYYLELGKVPGAFGATVSASSELIRGMGDAVDKNNGRIDMFTAAVASARGQNRELSDVIGDLKTVFKDYSLSGDGALNFSVRMSEISNNLGIDLSSVKDALTASADKFREFANTGDAAIRMTDGLATVTNQYAQALQAQGLSGNVALEVAQNMVGTINQMNIAQKAFLSSQTGGPGGLMGAFQIEKDLREGKITDVFKKVRDQMQRQLGGIVSLDDATKSPAAAAQLARQVSILQKGPLGQFARSDQEAFRILEAFKGGDEKIKALAPDALKNSMDKGFELQDQTRTIMSGIRSLTERQVALTEMTNLILVQNLTAATGARRGADVPWQERMRDAMIAQRSMAATRGANAEEQTTGALRAGAVNLDMSAINQGMAQNLGVFTTAIQRGQSAFITATQEAALKGWQAIKDKLSTTTDENKKGQLQNQLDEYTTTHREDLAAAIQSMNVPRTNNLTNAIQAASSFGPGTQLGATVKAATQNNVPIVTGGTNTPVGQIAPAITGGNLGDINVHVTGYCIKCKQEIEGGSQVSAISPAARRT